MKISTKGRYGLRILLDLAIHDQNEPRLIRDISESQQISLKYVSRLVINLRKAGLIQSTRGIHGGFRLNKAPSNISVLNVVEAMEGPLSIVGCVHAPEKCERLEQCATRDIWVMLNSGIRDQMEKLTLQDIIDNYRRRNTGDDWCDYCI
ncbi:MAG: RrF2 family transcriptional regulator [Thermoguttaceae bacterium]